MIIGDKVAAGLDLEGAKDSLTAAVAKLEAVLAADETNDHLAAQKQEIADLRAQCAVLIKENSTLNAALEQAEAAKVAIESRYSTVGTQLDNAIDQLQDVLTTN